MVSVIAPIDPPVVICNPNTGEVSFTWADSGNGMYEVEVTSISDITGELHEGVLDGTTFTVGSLDDGETVNIILTIFTDDACQMVSIASPGCVSQDCVAPTIVLDSDIMSFCLDEDSGIATITADVTSGETGSGMYSGSGIIDPVNGTFDPDSANIGMNTVTFQFMTDDFVPCIGQQTIQIEVLETPTASFFADVDTICITDVFNLSYDGTSGINAFTWDFGIDGSGSNSGADPSVTFTTAGEKTITLIVEKDGCISESVEIPVFVQPELEQVTINCSIQQIDEVEFSWNAVAGATGYLISINGGAPFEVTGTSYGETGLNPDDMVTITVTVLSDSKCPGNTDDQTCTAVSCPSFTFSYDDEVQDICVDGNYPIIELQAEAMGGTGMGLYTWSGTNVVEDQFDPNGLPEGTYEIFVTYQEDACEESGSVMVNITTIPTAEFSVDNTTICVGETVNIIYEGSQLPNQTIAWMSGGEDIVAGGNADEYVATFNSVGTFDIELNVENGECMTTPATASITVEPELVFDTITCLEDLDQIAFSWMDVDCASEYEVFIDGVSQGTQANTDYTVTGLAVGQEVTIEVIAVSGCACGNVMSTRICEAQECTPVEVSLATMDGITEFCLTEGLAPIEILAETNGSLGNGTFEWSGPGVDQNGIFDPEMAGIGTHTIVYDFLESAGCPYQESIIFIINEEPTVEVQYDEILCYDQLSTALEVIVTGGDGDYTITLNGEDSELMNDVEADTYTIVATDGNLCTDETSVTITTPAEPSPSISGDTELILGDSSSYSINSNIFAGNAIDSIIWTANGTVICNDPGCFDIGTQMPTETTVYEVIIHYNGNCFVTATITVEVTEPEPISVFEIPNIISPNNDGDNDEWQIVSNDENIIINSVRVFDRWGNMVFGFTGPASAKDNTIIWNGKYNDKILQPGVFVYFVDYSDERRANRIRSGDITIVN
jgi:gliding motility-associated-like protein